METESSNQATFQEAVIKPTLVINDDRNSANKVPEKSRPRNNVINKVPVINQTSEPKEDANEKKIDVDLNLMEPPPLISPISSPSPKNKNPPLNYEVHLLICASDQVAASKKIDKKLNYLGPHPRNQNHFRFSTHHDEKTINNLKNPQTLNFMSKSFGIQSIRMVSENKNYLPDKQFHCQDCRNRHIKNLQFHLVLKQLLFSHKKKHPEDLSTNFILDFFFGPDSQASTGLGLIKNNNFFHQQSSLSTHIFGIFNLHTFSHPILEYTPLQKKSSHLLKSSPCSSSSLTWTCSVSLGPTALFGFTSSVATSPNIASSSSGIGLDTRRTRPDY